jgi:hypothetical protein
MLSRCTFSVVQDTEQDYEKEKLQERIARLSGGVAIIQVSSGVASFHVLLALDRQPERLFLVLSVGMIESERHLMQGCESSLG